MRNRRRLFVLLAVAAAVVATVGTGGFSMTTADRDVSVDIVGDANAYMALVYSDTTVNVEDTGENVFLTVRNQFAEDGVSVTVDPSIEAAGVTADWETTDGTLDVGESLNSSVTFTCSSTVSGEESVTVSFHVTADGSGVFAETTEKRSVDYEVECHEENATTTTDAETVTQTTQSETTAETSTATTEVSTATTETPVATTETTAE